MRLCKQVEFIQGDDLNDLKSKVNQALMDGAELVNVDTSNLIGTIVVTIYVGEIKKTLLDELEDEFGRHTCGECPLLKENADRRCKWHTCERSGKKVQRSTSCCADFYREEGAREIPEDQGKDERVRPSRGGCRGMAQGIPASGVRPLEWSKQVPSVGVRIALGFPPYTDGRVIQGGLK